MAWPSGAFPPESGTRRPTRTEPSILGGATTEEPGASASGLPAGPLGRDSKGASEGGADAARWAGCSGAGALVGGTGGKGFAAAGGGAGCPPAGGAAPCVHGHVLGDSHPPSNRRAASDEATQRRTG